MRLIRKIVDHYADWCLAMMTAADIHEENERLRDDVDVAVIRYNRHAFDNDFDQIQLRSKK